MVETIGKRLCQARLSKGLTIDEAAHVTKMRPDKILALENDDYSRFGNNAYAKGFLQIYGRFLGVDTSEQFHELETVAPISVHDYQYLNNAPDPPKAHVRAQRPSGPPSVVPLLVFVSAFVVAGFVFWVIVNYQRMFDPSASAARHSTALGASAKVEGDRRDQGQSRNERTVAPSSPVREESQPAHGVPGASLNPAPVETVEVRRAEIVPPDPAAKPRPRPSAEPITPSGAVNEVVVEPIKKTWVKIRRGSPDSTPIFEDFLYPGAPPLKLRGTKFFVEVRDQSAVQILKNGNPIAYQAPGISIQ